MDVTGLIESGGLLAIAAIIFAESGLMVGFFLPGDTLLLSAGLLAAQGHWPIGVVIMVIATAAILGDNAGYQLGRVAGHRIFKKKDGILFRREYIERSEKFYEKHGSKTMLLSHFVPIVRSFAPAVAGAAKMPFGQFFVFDAIGTIIWAVAVTLIGYIFGSRIPNLDHYIMPVILLVVIISFTPVLWHLFGDKTARTRLFAKLKQMTRRSKSEDEKV